MSNHNRKKPSSLIDGKNMMNYLQEETKNYLNIIQSKDREIENLKSIMEQILNSQKHKIELTRINTNENMALRNRVSELEKKLKRKKEKLKYLEDKLSRYEYTKKPAEPLRSDHKKSYKNVLKITTDRNQSLKTEIFDVYKSEPTFTKYMETSSSLTQSVERQDSRKFNVFLTKKERIPIIKTDVSKNKLEKINIKDYYGYISSNTFNLSAKLANYSLFMLFQGKRSILSYSK